MECFIAYLRIFPIDKLRRSAGNTFANGITAEMYHPNCSINDFHLSHS